MAFWKAVDIRTLNGEEIEAAVRAEVACRGWTDADAEAFIRTHRRAANLATK